VFVVVVVVVDFVIYSVRKLLGTPSYNETRSLPVFLVSGWLRPSFVVKWSEIKAGHSSLFRSENNNTHVFTSTLPICLRDMMFSYRVNFAFVLWGNECRG
jgi:hypothetical protein